MQPPGRPLLIMDKNALWKYSLISGSPLKRPVRFRALLLTKVWIDMRKEFLYHCHFDRAIMRNFFEKIEKYSRNTEILKILKIAS